MESHVKILGVIWIALSALGLLASLLVLLAVVGGGLISGDPEAAKITAIVGPILAVVLVLVALPALVGGMGLMNYRNWARIVIVVLSILALTAFPFGTALGAYGIWALLIHPEGVQLFAGKPTIGYDPHGADWAR